MFNHLLSLLIWLPIVGTVPVLLAGSARPNLARWLADDYKLSPNEVAVVLGTAIHYDIAEVVDPLVHVVAKIEKSALARIAP